MDRIEAELFSDGGNNAILRMPGRAFPGIVVQGDTLSTWRQQLAAALRTDPADGETLDELDYFVSELSEVLGR
ncbi:MAG TPA: hypothetical protein DGG94_04065 [Micromonosporaceae bacterium]|nr:hypothetical protein [Micromonosporaceae bacterium]HCU48975.1 hypothetical protein [Micromonosporaceae bacterium]